MKLSRSQISQVKEWVSKRGFVYTDVQYEILDHVSTSIEKKMGENPNLTLEEAFNLTHREFGVFGFSEIEDSITKKFNKQLWLNCLAGFKEIISGPKILFPVSMIILIIFIQNRFTPYFHSSVYLLILTFSIFILGNFFKLYYNKKYLKNYLSFRISIGGVFAIIMIPLNTLYHIQTFIQPWGTIILFISFLLLEWSVLMGSRKMINKSDKLYKLYTNLV